MDKRSGFLMIFGGFWATVTGVFFSLPTLSPWVGVGGVVIALLYAASICWWQRKARAVAMGMTVVGAIAVPSTETLLVNLIVAMALCLNFWIFAELGGAWLKEVNRCQAFVQLAGLLAGALGYGWIVGTVWG